MILSRVPKVLFVLAVATVVYMLLSAVVWLGMANAQTAEAPSVVVTAPGASVVDIMTVVLLGAIAVLSGLRTILQFVAPRTTTTVDDRVLAKIEEILAALPTPPRVPVPLPVTGLTVSDAGTMRGGQQGSARLIVLCVLAAIGVGGMLTSGCAGSGPVLRAKATVATDAFLSCEEPNVSALAAEMTPFVLGTIRGWISGDGTPNAAGIRSAASKVTSMAGQCAWEAAIAVLMQPVSGLAGAPQAAPEAVDRGKLAAVWLQTRAELGWAPAR